MTGRGDGRYFRPDKDPQVQIGITTFLSSSQLPASSPAPLYIYLTARILKTPHPELPITFCTARGPFEHSPFMTNQSFDDIRCTYPETARKQGKKIGLWYGWPHFRGLSRNLADNWDFVTIPSVDSGDTLTVRHEVPERTIVAANVQAGEEYEVKLSNKCLGVNWWMYGEYPKGEGVRIEYWSERRYEPAEDEIEEVTDASNDDDDNVYRGQPHDALAFVDEGGPVTFRVI